MEDNTEILTEEVHEAKISKAAFKLKPRNPQTNALGRTPKPF